MAQLVLLVKEVEDSVMPEASDFLMLYAKILDS